MPDILFLTLRTFSATGGIEKVCRIMGKALYEQAIETGGTLEICSMYDKDSDADENGYFPADIFRGYEIKKIAFIRAMVRKGAKKDIVILSHINLLMIGWLIKKIAPSTKIVLLAHGIEIWDSLGGSKRKMLNRCDQIVSVSNYTRGNIIRSHGLPEKKCTVLNNCLDPFLPLPSGKKKNELLLKKYGFAATDTILFTLTRLSSQEKYKGYDKVIEAMARLASPGTKYLLGGKYDDIEKASLDKLIQQLGLTHKIVLCGYIPDETLVDHFALADIYIMPSKGEGFGIVFIEAMFYGLPVIAGNKDGSVDALLNGALGKLVDPENVAEIADAIQTAMVTSKADKKLLMDNFGYTPYKEKLKALLAPHTYLIKKEHDY